MDCGTSIVKYCLCLFNFIFVVGGTALLGFGIWLAVDQTSVLTLLRFVDQSSIKEYSQAAVIEQLGYVLIALGAFVFIISFLGYCGSIKESRFLLGAYAFFLTLIFILEIVVVVLFVVYRSQAESEVRNLLTISLHKFYSTQERANAFTLSADLVMSEGHCCGISNYTDFRDAQMFQQNKTSGQQVPVACCISQGRFPDLRPVDPNCIRNPNDANSYFRTGCFDNLMQQLDSKMHIAIIVAVILGLAQIIGIVFAICVYKAAYYDYK